jgi:hypothetical protein
MKPLLPAALLALALSVAGCSADSTGDSSCPVSGLPSPPDTSFGLGGQSATTWTAVPNATSYNLYLKVVANCDLLDMTQRVTIADQKFANVSSPFDDSPFNRCHTCYYQALTTVSGSCESAPGGTLGFMLRPCS